MSISDPSALKQAIFKQQATRVFRGVHCTDKKPSPKILRVGSWDGVRCAWLDSSHTTHKDPERTPSQLPTHETYGGGFL